MCHCLDEFYIRSDSYSVEEEHFLKAHSSMIIDVCGKLESEVHIWFKSEYICSVLVIGNALIAAFL